LSRLSSEFECLFVPPIAHGVQLLCEWFGAVLALIPKSLYHGHSEVLELPGLGHHSDRGLQGHGSAVDRDPRRRDL
jgi:hypothetical protein